MNSWITAADNKSSILLAFVGLIVGLSTNMYGQVTNNLVNGTVFEIIFSIIIGLLYLSTTGLIIVNPAFVFIARTKNKDIFPQNLVSFVSILEMDDEKYSNIGEKANYRNGTSKKTVRSDLGEVELDIPRDRNGEFEPKLVPKHSRDISMIEEKIISMYGKEMTTRDISDHINDMYGFELSAESIS